MKARDISKPTIGLLMACWLGIACIGESDKKSTVWVDPATKLMWAGRDNGRDIQLRRARDYCRDLRLEGYADWRLPTIEELEAISDRSLTSLGIFGGKDPKVAIGWHIKGHIFLSGYTWSSSRSPDFDGNPSSLFFYYDFLNRKRIAESGSWTGGEQGMRALCVRATAK